MASNDLPMSAPETEPAVALLAGLDVDAARAVWESALCAQVDPELFFAEKGHVDQVRDALAVCELCPVTALCLETFGRQIGHGCSAG
jgi:hypothetical protein